MDSLLQSTPIRRQLFKQSGEIERRGNSCVISFSRPRRRGRAMLGVAIIVCTLLLLGLSGQAGIAGF